MSCLTLAALIDSKPSRPFWGWTWIEEVLSQHLPGFCSQKDQRLNGWSVGAAVGGETFVQSRPVARDREDGLLDDLLRVEAPCSVAAIETSSDDAQRLARDFARIARFRRFISVQTPTHFDESQRHALQADLPDFLRRDASRKTDAELVLSRFLANLVDRGAFGKVFAAPETIREALRDLDRYLDDEPANLFVSDGRTLAIRHRSGLLLAFEPPADLRPQGGLRSEADASSSPVTLFLWLPEPTPTAVIAGAERIAPGVLSIQVQRPGTLARG